MTFVWTYFFSPTAVLLFNISFQGSQKKKNPPQLNFKCLKMFVS